MSELLDEYVQLAFDIRARARERYIGHKVAWESLDGETAYGEITEIDLCPRCGLIFVARPYDADGLLMTGDCDWIAGSNNVFGWHWQEGGEE